VTVNFLQVFDPWQSGYWQDADERFRRIFWEPPGAARAQPLGNLRLERRWLLGGGELFGGSQWVILTREFCRYVSSWRNTWRYRLFFRNTYVPDEAFFQTVIMNSPLRGTVAQDNRRFIDWWSGPERPRILRSEDIDRVLASDAWFARKFDEAVDGVVLRQLEEWLAVPGQGETATMERRGGRERHGERCRWPVRRAGVAVRCSRAQDSVAPEAGRRRDSGCRAAGISLARRFGWCWRAVTWRGRAYDLSPMWEPSYACGAAQAGPGGGEHGRSATGWRQLMAGRGRALGCPPRAGAARPLRPMSGNVPGRRVNTASRTGSAACGGGYCPETDPLLSRAATSRVGHLQAELATGVQACCGSERSVRPGGVLVRCHGPRAAAGAKASAAN